MAFKQIKVQTRFKNLMLILNNRTQNIDSRFFVLGVCDKGKDGRSNIFSYRPQLQKEDEEAEENEEGRKKR